MGATTQRSVLRTLEPFKIQPDDGLFWFWSFILVPFEDTGLNARLLQSAYGRAAIIIFGVSIVALFVGV